MLLERATPSLAPWISHPSLLITSSMLITSPNAYPTPLSPASCCFLLALPHASSTNHVSYPLLKALLAVVSQQQSVMTPHTTTRSTSFSSNNSARLVLMNASYVFFATTGYPFAASAIWGCSDQSGLPVAMEPSGPHLRTSWFLKGGFSSALLCPCCVKMSGREDDLKCVIRERMLGRARVVMGAKKACMSIMRRAVVML